MLISHAASETYPCSKITSLNHKCRNDAVERAACDKIVSIQISLTGGSTFEMEWLALLANALLA